MIEYHVHIRSTDQFKQAGVRGKNSINEINGVDDHYIWLRIRITSSSSIVFFVDWLLADLCPLNLKFCLQFFSCFWLFLHFCKGASNTSSVVDHLVWQCICVTISL